MSQDPSNPTPAPQGSAEDQISQSVDKTFDQVTKAADDALNAPVAEPEPEPVAEPTPEPVVEPTPEPVVEPEPVAVAEPEPVVEPEPVAEPTPNPIVETAPAINTSPETPEVPETPEAPETPEVPETPEAPETPEVPETPEAPDTAPDETVEEGEGEAGDAFSKLKAYGEEFYDKVKATVTLNNFFNHTTAGIWLKKEYITLEDLLGFHKELSAEGATTAEHQELLDVIAEKLPSPTEEGAAEVDNTEEDTQ